MTVIKVINGDINMSNIAILGHPTRGREVIQLLEMLGGENKYSAQGNCTEVLYFIYDNKSIKYLMKSDARTDLMKVFTLEEFEEKYPYKVGDIVKCYNIWEGIIESMEWYGGEVLYHVRHNSNNYLTPEAVENLQPYKEENMETEKITIIPQLPWGKDKIELEVTNGCEIKYENGKTYVVKKKPQYPKSYEECEASGFSSNPVIVAMAQGVCMNSFAKLIVIRNTYWEIAGKKMGLGKPWEYDMSKDEFVYAIVYQYGYIQKCEVRYKNHILVFPTAEMRDTFYENFKKLINETKELL